MTSLKRRSTVPYMYDIEMAPLNEIANQEKKVPREWINEAGNDVRPEIVEYMRPLIQGEVSIAYRDGLPSYIPISHLSKLEDK